MYHNVLALTTVQMNEICQSAFQYLKQPHPNQYSEATQLLPILQLHLDYLESGNLSYWNEVYLKTITIQLKQGLTEETVLKVSFGLLDRLADLLENRATEHSSILALADDKILTRLQQRLRTLKATCLVACKFAQAVCCNGEFELPLPGAKSSKAILAA